MMISIVAKKIIREVDTECWVGVSVCDSTEKVT